MPLTENLTIWQGEKIIGWIFPPNACTVACCVEQSKAGKIYHAMPRNGFLATTHFATTSEAVAALKEFSK